MTQPLLLDLLVCPLLAVYGNSQCALNAGSQAIHWPLGHLALLIAQLVCQPGLHVHWMAASSCCSLAELLLYPSWSQKRRRRLTYASYASVSLSQCFCLSTSFFTFLLFSTCVLIAVAPGNAHPNMEDCTD